MLRRLSCLNTIKQYACFVGSKRVVEGTLIWVLRLSQTRITFFALHRPIDAEKSHLFDVLKHVTYATEFVTIEFRASLAEQKTF